MPLRASLAPLLQWLRQHDWLYADAVPAPAVLVPFQPAATGAGWLANAQALAAGLSLLRAQIPFAFTADRSDTTAAMFPLDDSPFAQPALGRLLDLPWLRRLADPGMRTLARAYFGTVHARRWLDRSGLTRRFLESPWFRLPDNWIVARQLTPAIAGPHATADAPILVERWKHPRGPYRLHLVNYTDSPVEVTLHSAGPRTLHTPDSDSRWLEGAHRRLHLVRYAVVESAS